MRTELSPLEQMDQTIDTMTRRYHQAIVDLKIQRNRLAPISKIPHDVLYNIIKTSQNVIVNPYDLVPDKLRWINLTYVCHDWRNLALASPCLWSNPQFDNPRWAKKMLIRSKTAKLTIQADSFNFTNPEQRRILLDALQTRMLQIKSVDVNFPGEYTEILDLISGSAPSLQSMALHRLYDSPYSYYRPNHLELAGLVPMKLPQGSLCGKVHLRRIDISGIGVDWDVHLPSSLTSLVLRDIHILLRPTMVQVWDALERMPLLETLYLEAALPAAPDISDRRIRLDRLQNLTIETGFPVMEAFLQTIIVPSTAKFHIHCVRDGPSEHVNVKETIAFLQQFFTNSTSKNDRLKFEYFLEDRHARSRIGFVVFPHSSQESLYNVPNGSFDVTLCQGEGSQEDYLLWDAPIRERILLSLFQHTPFNSLTRVALTGHINHFSLSALLHTIGSLPHVCELALQLGPTTSQALQSHLHDDSEDVDCLPRVSFPSLQKLHVTETFFDDRARPPGRKISIPVQGLMDCLTWREQQGVPVRVLGLTECDNVHQEDVDRLKDLVEQVFWDDCTSLSYRLDAELVEL